MVLNLLCLCLVIVQWMFLQLNPLWDGPIKQLLVDADTWLCKRRSGTLAFSYVGHVMSQRVVCLRVMSLTDNTTHHCLLFFFVILFA